MPGAVGTRHPRVPRKIDETPTCHGNSAARRTPTDTRRSETKLAASSRRLSVQPVVRKSFRDFGGQSRGPFVFAPFRVEAPGHSVCPMLRVMRYVCAVAVSLVACLATARSAGAQAPDPAEQEKPVPVSFNWEQSAGSVNTEEARRA